MPTRPAAAYPLFGHLERVAMAFGGAIMIVIVAASVIIAERTDANVSSAEQSQETRFVTIDLLDAVLSAETSQRGFLLTRRQSYLDPYRDAVVRVPALLDRLSGLLAGDTRVKQWRAAIEDKMRELAETVRLTEAGHLDEALALVQTDRGREDMVLARTLALALMAEQRQALSDNLMGSRSGTRLLVLIDVVGLVQLLLLIVYVGRRLQLAVRALAQSGEALEAANAALEAGRERLEATVAERTADLSSANEEIQRFAYIVSHDLRAPLLNIIGFTSELENATQRLNRFVAENLEPAGIVVPQDVREASRDDLPEAIRFIQTSTAKMDRLITAILRLSREGRRVLAPERLDMAALLGGVFDSMRHQADSADATLALGATPPVVSDRIGIEQVFSNLVENALKYRAPGRAPHIEITGRTVGAMVRYETRDNGRGVAARDHQRIFELFRRAGQQDTAGEGIGLAHVRTLLRRMGGTIDCESTPDVGSTFIVMLPAVLAPRGAGMAADGMELE
jgi:signal transduction histidine kinase